MGGIYNIHHNSYSLTTVHRSLSVWIKFCSTTKKVRQPVTVFWSEFISLAKFTQFSLSLLFVWLLFSYQELIICLNNLRLGKNINSLMTGGHFNFRNHSKWVHVIIIILNCTLNLLKAHLLLVTQFHYSSMSSSFFCTLDRTKRYNRQSCARKWMNQF